MSTSIVQSNSCPPGNSLFEWPSFQLDIVKISQVATACIVALVCADLAWRAGTFLIGSGLLTSPIVWIVGGSILVALLVITGGIFAYHRIDQYYRYNDPARLKEQKEQAKEQNFYRLYQDHTLENLVNHIFNDDKNKDDAKEVLQEKFKKEIAGQSIDTLKLYDLNELVRYRIITDNFKNAVEELQTTKNQIEKSFSEKLEMLDNTYPQRTDKMKNHAMRAERPLSAVWKTLLPINPLGRAALIPMSVTFGSKLDDEFGTNFNAQLDQVSYTQQKDALLSAYKEQCTKIEDDYRKLLATY